MLICRQLQRLAYIIETMVLTDQSQSDFTFNGCALHCLAFKPSAMQHSRELYPSLLSSHFLLVGKSFGLQPYILLTSMENEPIAAHLIAPLPLSWLHYLQTPTLNAKPQKDMKAPLPPKEPYLELSRSKPSGCITLFPGVHP